MTTVRLVIGTGAYTTGTFVHIIIGDRRETVRLGDLELFAIEVESGDDLAASLQNTMSQFKKNQRAA